MDARKYNIDSVKVRVMISALNGAVAGMVAGFITTPFDVVKSRMMVNTVKDHKRNIKDWFKYILQDEGCLALFKGGLIRTAIMGAGGFAYFCIYYYGLVRLRADDIFHKVRE